MDRFKNTTGFKLNTTGDTQNSGGYSKKEEEIRFSLRRKKWKNTKRKEDSLTLQTLISSPIKVFGCTDSHEAVCICQLGENSHLIAVLKLHSYCHLLILLFPRSVCTSEWNRVSNDARGEKWKYISQTDLCTCICCTIKCNLVSCFLNIYEYFKYVSLLYTHSFSFNHGCG